MSVQVTFREETGSGPHGVSGQISDHSGSDEDVYGHAESSDEGAGEFDEWARRSDENVPAGEFLSVTFPTLSLPWEAAAFPA